MTRTQISAWIMLFFCGLWSGGILIFAVERTNLWRRMPLEQYAVDFRRSLFRADPMMPILGLTAGAVATFFALNRSGAATVFAWAGIGFIVLVVVASITIAEPINSKFRRLPEGQMPERAEHYRTLWRRFHAARNLAALAALACLAAAAVASDGGRRDLGFKAVVPSSAQTVCLLKNPRYFERDSHGAFFLTSALLAVQPPSSKMPSIGIVKYPDRACGTNA